MTQRAQPGGASLCCDTSVLVAALSSWHPDHGAAREVVAAEATGIPAHVFVECYSVLTRLPARQRVSAEVAAAALTPLASRALDLPASAVVETLARCAREGIRGGSTYDALVAATAVHHDRVLVTLDERARPTYAAIGVQTRPL